MVNDQKDRQDLAGIAKDKDYKSPYDNQDQHDQQQASSGIAAPSNQKVTIISSPKVITAKEKGKDKDFDRDLKPNGDPVNYLKGMSKAKPILI